MVICSTNRGRHSKKHVQFETIHQLRTSHGNFDHISALNIHICLTMSNAAGESSDIEQSSANSIWFRRLFSGLKFKMGKNYRPNLALTMKIIISLLKIITNEINLEKDDIEKFNLIMFEGCVFISDVLSFRGSEGLMLNLSTIRKEFDVKRDYCIVALKGKLKGESIERDYIFPLSK